MSSCSIKAKDDSPLKTCDDTRAWCVVNYKGTMDDLRVVLRAPSAKNEEVIPSRSPLHCKREIG